MRRPENISVDLLDMSRHLGAKPALIVGDDHVTYRDLDRLVWQASGLLYENGVRVGDVVGVLVNDELFRVVITLAILRIGATVLPLPRSLTVYQRNELLAQVGCGCVVTDFLRAAPDNVSLLRADMAAVKVMVNISYSIFCEEPGSHGLLVQGSGSTGRAKVIPQTHSILRERIKLAFGGCESYDCERVLSLTNLEYAAGVNRLLSVIAFGGAFAVNNLQSVPVPEYCATQGITTLFTSVFHLQKLLASVPPKPYPILSSLRSLRVSGSCVNLELRLKVCERLSKNMQLVYGANECGRISFSFPPDVYTDSFTVGRVLPGVEVLIKNSAGSPLSNGERGEIWVKTPSVVSGYLDDHEATAAAFNQGWFRTGDIGEFSSDGTLRHFGRFDDMMIVNGINIHPAEIEGKLKEIAGVEDVVVCAVNHAVHQDIPVACVVIAANSGLSVKALHEFAIERLGFRAPRGVIKLDRIPRNENGKLQRSTLDDLIGRMNLEIH